MTTTALNKSDLIERIAAKQINVTEATVEDAVKTMIDQMIGTLATNNRIEIRGFGSFSLHYRPPRNAHNPKTGEKVVTEAKHSPHFKPGKELRERVDASREHCPLPKSD